MEALLRDGFDVQVLTRKADPSQDPSGVRVTEVDYSNASQLESVLEGQDAVVSALGGVGLGSQTQLIEAAVNAGVKRFLPSEFGSNLDNPRVRTYPLSVEKLKAQQQLKSAAEKTADFSYTCIYCGPFLDWGISTYPFLLDVKARSAEVFDSGNVAYSTTRLSTVGKAVSAVLRKPDETKNRRLCVHDAVITQNQLIARAEETLGVEFAKSPVDSDELEKSAWALSKDSSVNPQQWFWSFIKLSVWGKVDAYFRNADNALLGIPELDGRELNKVLDEQFRAVEQSK